MAQQPDMKELEVRFVAGRPLLSELKAIGIEPDLLSWALIGGDPQLVMVTTLVDRIGPLKLYELLQRAQDAGRITSSIDLWELRLYSPKSEVGLDLEQSLSRIPRDGLLPLGDDAVQDVPVERAVFAKGVHDQFVMFGRGIYHVASRHFSADEDIRRFKRAEKRLPIAA